MQTVLGEAAPSDEQHVPWRQPAHSRSVVQPSLTPAAATAEQARRSRETHELQLAAARAEELRAAAAAAAADARERNRMGLGLMGQLGPSSRGVRGGASASPAPPDRSSYHTPQDRPRAIEDRIRCDCFLPLVVLCKHFISVFISRHDAGRWSSRTRRFADR